MLSILRQVERWDELFTSRHARSVHRYSVTNPSISFFSPKNNKTMFIESRAEFNYALLLERDPEVIRFQSQPFSFDYAKGRRYTPDFIEDRGSHLALTEVKPSDKILSEKEKIKYSTIAELCFDNEAYFSIEFVEHNDPVVKQQRQLYRMHAHEYVFLFSDRPNYEGPIKDLINKYEDKELALCAIYAGVFKGAISIETEKKICQTSIIKWGL
jgi:hypothetical protein